MVLAGVQGSTGSTGPRGNTGPVDSYVRTFNGLTGDLQGVSAIQGGTGISVNGRTGNVIVSNIGVLSLTGSTGILLNGTTGNISIQNSGVLSINGVTGILEGVSSLTLSVSPAPGLTLSGSTGAIVIRNTGVLGVAAGSGIQILTGATGVKTFNNTGVLSVNALTGNVGITAGTNINISSSGNTLTISAPNQFTLNGLTGSVTISAGNNIGISLSGNNITLSSAGACGSCGPIILDDNVYIRGVCGAVGDPKAIIAIDPVDNNILISSSNGIIGLNDYDPTINGAGIALNTVTKSITLGAQNISIIGNVKTITGNLVNTFNGATGNIQGVNSINVSSGLTLASGSTGNVTIVNTGVRKVTGTSNQITITPTGGTGDIVASLPTTIIGVNNISSQEDQSLTLASPGQSTIGSSIVLGSSIVNINPSLTVSGSQIVTGNLSVSGTYNGTVVRSFNGSTGAVQGVSTIVKGVGILLSGPTGNVQITNTGVLSFNGTTGNIQGVRTFNGATGGVTLVGGTGITVTTSGTQTTVGLTNLIAGPTGATGATGAFGLNSGIISQYKEFSINCFGAAGFTAGIFYFVLCNTVGGPDCTCVNSSNNRASGFIISGIEYFGADISAYFENLISVSATTGYLFIRYYNSDPSRANYMKPLKVTGIQKIENGSNKNFCFSIEQIGAITLPTNNDIYSIVYQQVFF